MLGSRLFEESLAITNDVGRHRVGWLIRRFSVEFFLRHQDLAHLLLPVIAEHFGGWHRCRSGQALSS